MADYYLEQAIMFEEMDDYFEEDIVSGSRRLTKTCQRCGKEGLHWQHTPAGWRLHEPNDTKHCCSAIDFVKHNNINSYLMPTSTTIPYLRWAQRLKFYKVI